MPTERLPSPIQTVAAGLKFRTEMDRKVAAALMHDDPLRLEREPTNAHDPNAIKVLAEGGHHIGYVPAIIARRLAPVLDSGARLVCTVVEYVEYVPMVAITIDNAPEPEKQ